MIIQNSTSISEFEFAALRVKLDAPYCHNPFFRDVQTSHEHALLTVHTFAMDLYLPTWSSTHHNHQYLHCLYHLLSYQYCISLAKHFVNLSFVILLAFDLVIYLTISMLAIYFFARQVVANKMDVKLTRVLILNGLSFYATELLRGLLNVSVIFHMLSRWIQQEWAP